MKSSSENANSATTAGSSTGSEVEAPRLQSAKSTIEDYDLGKVVGQGAYGTVTLSKDKATGEVVAIKSVSKQQIQKLGKERHIFREKNLLNEMDHPFIIKLLGTTMDSENLYFVFENCENGDMADLIGSSKQLSLEVTRVYTAQLVHTLSYLQECEIMHRDLKPQNLLLDKDYNIKMIDFGDAKKESELPLEDEGPQAEEDEDADVGSEFSHELMEEFKEDGDKRRGTFVGTVNYLAPEMVADSMAFCESDLWALGCIIFKMITGKVPFPGMSEYAVMPLIKERKIDWPKHQTIDPVCHALIDQLIQLNPKDRLGARDTTHGMEALKAHPFFEGIDFKSDLKNLGVKKLVEETEMKSISEFAQREVARSELPGARFSIIDDGKPILGGIILKKNKWMLKQERTFQLFANGSIKYFKDKDQKGTIQLTKNAKVFKISRSEIEIVLPENRKNYTFNQYDLKKAPPSNERYSCVLDDWVEAMKFVISRL